MVNITGSRDCGNSPKNRFAQNAAIALECGEIPDGMFEGTAVWLGLADERVQGIDAIRQRAAERPAIAILIEHAISHGRGGMANGVTTTAEGTIRRFCHVFEFTSARGNCVAAISSYR